MKTDELRSAEDLERAVLKLGFLPFFKNRIEGFSVEEMTPPELWFAEGTDGPWEWKGPVVRNWNCIYGKLFGGRAGYVSLEWLPDLANCRRANYGFDMTPLDGEGRNREKEIYDAVVAHESLLSKEIKSLCGFRKTKKPHSASVGGWMSEKLSPQTGESFETAMTRLQMATMLIAADFEYQLDKCGQPYGWGIARYTTPEILFGAQSVDCGNRTPQESAERIVAHIRRLFPHAAESLIRKLVE